MKKYIILYKGPATPPNASHEGWPEWFDQIGDKLVNIGSPMEHGARLRGDGSINDEVTSLNGYSIIQARDRSEALALLKDHPYLALGSEYTIEAFEIPKQEN